MKKSLISGLILLFLPLTLSLNGQKRIYIAPDDHTDLWWLADIQTYNQAFLDMVDYYINLADNTQSELSNYQSRWNCDGSYWMWNYEKNRSPAQFQKLISYIRSGDISVPLNPLAVVWGSPPAEAIIRAMYYPGKIERQYNLRLPLVYTMENQTLPLGLATLWGEAGAKYSWKGVCQCNTSVNATNRDHEIYWMQGLDNSKILMKWYSQTSSFSNTGPGGYAEARNPGPSIQYVDSDPTFIARYPFPVIGLFGKGWDDLETLTDEFVSVAKSATNASRSVIVSNEIDFFEDFEANHGNAIPTQSLSFGNDWDLGAASIQEISSRLKRSTEKLRNAEAIATFAALSDPSFLTGRENAKDQAWMNMGLFFEHNIPMHPGPYASNVPARRAAWQKQLVDGMESYVNTLQNDAIALLGNRIIKTTANTRYFIFNSLSWTRTDIADLAYNLAGPVKVIDLTNNQEVPSQFVQINGNRYLRILARDVPAVGYKVFEIINQAGENFGNAATVSGNTIENSFYRLTVTGKGSVSSIISKKHVNQEFVQSFSGKAVNDLGGAATGSVTVENSGPVSVSFVINSPDILNHTTRITLFREIDRIDIHNTINQNFTSTETWSFGFNIPGHTIRHEEVGAILKAKTAANGGHYANKNASYSWLTLNHFADISNNNLGVTLSNADCYFMKTGSSTLTNLDESVPRISALAGGRINDLGIPNQGGDNSFTQRFALKTHDQYTPASSMRFSLEHQNPLITGVVNGGSFFPETSMSLISIDNPDVILWSLKPSEEGIGSGIIARVWNLSETPGNFAIEPEYPILSAQNVTLIETPVSDANVQNNRISGQVNSFGFKTFNFKVNTTTSNTLVVTPQSRSVGSASGVTTFSVTSNVNWNVSDDAAWLTATKTNASVITVTYNENTSTADRSANIIVSGTGGLSQTVTVIQAGAGAVLDVSPNSRSVSSVSGSTTFTVAANIDWSVTDDTEWLTATKTDNATITVTFTENTSVVSRTANITVTGTGGVTETVTVIQAGAGAVLDVSPNSRSVSSVSGSTTFTVAANIDWSVTDDTEWLTATKTDNATITVTFTENTSVVSRTANITVTGTGGVTETVTVIQAGAGAVLDVSPNSRSVSPVSGSTTFTVAANTEWSVTDDTEWLTATKTDDATITVPFTENTSVVSRTANITVTGTGGVTETVTVIQAGAGAVLDVSPNSRSVSPVSGSTTFTVAANTDWSVTDDAAWMAVVRTDAVTISANYEENNSTTSRTGNISVTGTGGISEDVTLIQDWEPEVNPPLKDFNVIVYPNPVKSSIVLKFDKTIIEKIKVSITDEVGRLYYVSTFSGTGTDNEIPVDLSFLISGGLYIVSVNIEGIVKVVKIIKEQLHP